MKLRTKKVNFTVKIGNIDVTVSQPTAKEIAELREKHPDDQSAFAEELFCKTVKKWAGATDDSGKALKCTESNKKAVYAFDQSFAARVLSKIQEAEIARIEEMSKN